MLHVYYSKFKDKETDIELNPELEELADREAPELEVFHPPPSSHHPLLTYLFHRTTAIIPKKVVSEPARSLKP